MEKTILWLFAAMAFVFAVDKSLWQTKAEQVDVQSLCYQGPFMFASLNSSRFCGACSELAGSNTNYEMAGDFSSGNFTCNGVLGRWGGAECSFRPYEPRTCIQAANLTVHEPTCSNGGSMDPCAYNLTMAMMTTGEDQDYVYLGRGDGTCPKLQGYASGSRDAVVYSLPVSFSVGSYEIVNVGGQLRIRHDDCSAVVHVLSGSFLNASAGPQPPNEEIPGTDAGSGLQPDNSSPTGTPGSSTSPGAGDSTSPAQDAGTTPIYFAVLLVPLLITVFGQE
eukprot:scaffold544_cov320-Pavlova_lutheri.AAC.44